MKSKFILVIAVIFTVVTTILFSNYLKDLDKKYKSDNNLVQVAVLKQNIKKNQVVTRDMLELKSYSTNAVLPEALKDTKGIEGSYALVDIRAGEMLFADRFTTQTKEKEVLTRKIGKGNRAVSIGVDYVKSVSTIIEPEDFVDIIYSKKETNGTFTTSTLLENVRVLAVGQRIAEPQSSASDTAKTIVQGSNNNDGGQARYSSITLELNPKQVEQVTNAEMTGDLRFVLRSKLEQQ